MRQSYKRILNEISNTHALMNELPSGPIIETDNNDDSIVASISCDGAFTDIQNGVDIQVYNPDRNVTIPLTEPILTDVLIRFDYDAYFKDGISEDDQLNSIKEISDKIFTSLVHKSPLVDEDTRDSDGITPTDETCDSLLENTLKSMLTSMGVDVVGGGNATSSRALDNNDFFNLRKLTDIDGYEWDYFLGWKNEPMDTYSNNPNCTSALTIQSTTCTPITSSFTAKIPILREDLDSYAVQTQVLKDIKLGFEQNEFLTSNTPVLQFVGTQNGFLSKPQDTIEDSKASFKDRIVKVMSAFGISATALLGFVTLFSCGLFGYKVSKGRSSSSGRSRRDRQVLLKNVGNSKSLDQSGLEQARPEKSRATLTHASNDGIEIVDVNQSPFVANMDETELDSKVQTGFGVSLGAFMDALRGEKEDVDLNSNAGSSTLDKIDLNEREYNDLLGIDEERLDEDMQEKKWSVLSPPSPSRVRSRIV